MKKRILSLFLAGTACLSLSACGNTGAALSAVPRALPEKTDIKMPETSIVKGWQSSTENFWSMTPHRATAFGWRPARMDKRSPLGRQFAALT